jgi:hypothetical protein
MFLYQECAQVRPVQAQEGLEEIRFLFDFKRCQGRLQAVNGGALTVTVELSWVFFTLGMAGKVYEPTSAVKPEPTDAPPWPLLKFTVPTSATVLL